MALQLISDLGRLIVKVTKSLTIGHTHKHSVRPFWKSDQLVTEATTCTTHNVRMMSAGFETAIPVIERLLTYALRPGSASTLYNPGKSHHCIKCQKKFSIPYSSYICEHTWKQNRDCWDQTLTGDWRSEKPWRCFLTPVQSGTHTQRNDISPYMIGNVRRT
jgi:hypothetical protein